MDRDLKMVGDYLTLREEAGHLAKQLFGDKRQQCARFTNRLLDICTEARDKDILLIHNPGGWGITHLENLLPWERSIVEGVSATIGGLGYNFLLRQYFRTNHGWWGIMRDMREQTRFFNSKAKVMAAELKFITQHLSTLKVILLGASQGAAFSNAVMRRIGELDRVYSIELGIFFSHMSRRVVTGRTLAIDNNGVMPDPIANRNLKVVARSYLSAPFRWARYRLQGKPQKFTYCINAPGHNYNWEYPEVQQQIRDFLNLNLGNKDNQEVTVK